MALPFLSAILKCQIRILPIASFYIPCSNAYYTVLELPKSYKYFSIYIFKYSRFLGYTKEEEAVTSTASNEFPLTPLKVLRRTHGLITKIMIYRSPSLHYRVYGVRDFYVKGGDDKGLRGIIQPWINRSVA